MLNKKPRPGIRATGAQTGDPKPEETLTKERVNELMRKRVERSHQAFFNRYGVKDLTELDNLVGKSRSYDATIQRYDELEKSNNDLMTQHKDLTKRYAFKVGNIDSNKYSDIETYFKGKGVDIDENSLMEELKRHPDWQSKVSTVEVVGSEANTPTPQSEAEIASKLLGVDLT